MLTQHFEVDAMHIMELIRVWRIYIKQLGLKSFKTSTHQWPSVCNIYREFPGVDAPHGGAVSIIVFDSSHAAVPRFRHQRYDGRGCDQYEQCHREFPAALKPKENPGSKDSQQCASRLAAD